MKIETVERDLRKLMRGNARRNPSTVEIHLRDTLLKRKQTNYTQNKRFQFIIGKGLGLYRLRLGDL